KLRVIIPVSPVPIVVKSVHVLGGRAPGVVEDSQGLIYNHSRQNTLKPIYTQIRAQARYGKG
ncbi:hypothetical protein MLJ47_25840, partial [Escherichia coli]|nr:hypothetical protein [Escherichia coli]